MSELVAHIEGEFDEPLRDVILGMREQGCTWRTIAGALGVSRPQVYLWRKALGIVDTRRLRDALSTWPTRITMAAKELGYRNAAQAIVDLRMSHSLEETAAILGVAVRTVTRHYPPGFSGTVFTKTEKYIEGRKRTGQMTVERCRQRGRCKWSDGGKRSILPWEGLDLGR